MGRFERRADLLHPHPRSRLQDAVLSSAPIDSFVPLCGNADHRRLTEVTTMKLSMMFLTPVLLCAEEADRVTQLIETMRQLTFTGDQSAVGHIVPSLIRELAKPHAQGALAWNQIGVYYTTQGDFSRAEDAYRRGLRMVEHGGSDRNTLALLLLNLGELYLEADGGVSHGINILRRALTLAGELYKPESQELSHFLYVLAAAEHQYGNRRHARTLFERALLIAGRSSDRAFQRSLILANLAVLRAGDGQWQEARDTILQAIALQEQTLGLVHPELAPAYINLARIQIRLKHWDLANVALEKARTITETQLGADHRYMVAILESSAMVLRKTGHRSEAKEQSHRAKVIRKSLKQHTVGRTWIHVSDLR